MMPRSSNKLIRRRPMVAPPGVERDLRAFTLIEMLVVLAIIAIIAGLALPAIRGNSEAVALKAAAYQVVEDLSWARQKAISQRSTVAVVFLTDALFSSAQVDPSRATLPDEKENIRALKAGIFTHYAVFSFRRVGEQPGRSTSGYITEWKALPEKTFFPTNGIWSIRNLSVTNFPFPFGGSANRPTLPYIAFDHEGRPVELLDVRTGRAAQRFESITNSVARGAVFYGRDNRGEVTTMEIQEIPPGNGANTLFVVDGVTGRAKREELGVQ